ncbi:MAG: FlgD immunoglobulin-like domain containing protein, partial [bacterium]
YTSSTVGIQDQSRTIAIQYLFNGNYHRGAAGVVRRRAVNFVTGSPNTGVDEGGGMLGISRLELNLNPNPLRARAWINFVVPGAALVKLGVYDIAGREVRSLLNSKLQAGSWRLSWDGKDEKGKELAQGIYFLRLLTTTKEHQDDLTAKVVLIR